MLHGRSPETYWQEFERPERTGISKEARLSISSKQTLLKLTPGCGPVAAWRPGIQGVTSESNDVVRILLSR